MQNKIEFDMKLMNKDFSFDFNTSKTLLFENSIDLNMIEKKKIFVCFFPRECLVIHLIPTPNHHFEQCPSAY